MPKLLNTKYWISSSRKELWDYLNEIMEKNKIEIEDNIEYFPDQNAKFQLNLAKDNEKEDYEITKNFKLYNINYFQVLTFSNFNLNF